MIDCQVVKRILEIRGKELKKEISDIIHSPEFDVNTRKVGCVYKTLMQQHAIISLAKGLKVFIKDELVKLLVTLTKKKRHHSRCGVKKNRLGQDYQVIEGRIMKNMIEMWCRPKVKQVLESMMNINLVGVRMGMRIGVLMEVLVWMRMMMRSHLMRIQM